MAFSYNLLECSFKDSIRWFEKTDTIIVPIGSCEKHGAHLPLGTDSYTTINVTERAAKCTLHTACTIWIFSTSYG